MESFKFLLEYILHFDKYLKVVFDTYGVVTYGIVFLIIFLETGFVVTPFLPGDSLLFVLGAFAGAGVINIWFLYFLLLAAAILGDTVNYWMGHILGSRVFSKENSRFFKREYLERTEKFYEKYGGKTVILARFVPIIRTFAPFVAGVGSMSYGKFITFNIVGGFLWVTLFLFAGFFFGNIPFIKERFHEMVIVIILVSVIPVVVEFVKHRREKKHKVEVSYSEIEKTFKKEHLK